MVSGDGSGVAIPHSPPPQSASQYLGQAVLISLSLSCPHPEYEGLYNIQIEQAGMLIFFKIPSELF